MNSTKICIEYVWIDADGELRSKLRVENSDFIDKSVDKISWWNFDGSSTKQATGKSSDVLLKPSRLYNNPFMKGYLLLCECYNRDGTPHPTNTRDMCVNTSEKYKEYEFLFGMEQEYFIVPNNNDKDELYVSNKDGKYYCSVGGDRAFGRTISNEHLELCLLSGIDICGTNGEVSPYQWEFQIGICDPVKVSDDLIMARYLLCRLSEKHNCMITFHPKPYPLVNGSGCHTNISTKNMRQEGGLLHIENACEKLRQFHNDHIMSYGKDNHLRMTGHCETSSINEFSWGHSDRGSSIRIPLQVTKDKKGYFEDRRPASNCDPYIVTELLIRNISKI